MEVSLPYAQSILHQRTAAQAMLNPLEISPGRLFQERKAWRRIPFDFVVLLTTDSNGSRAWWSIPVIPAFGKQRQEDHKFEANLDYKVKL
jgi:hypothetical protein